MGCAPNEMCESYVQDALRRLATDIVEFEWTANRRGSKYAARAIKILLSHARDSIDYKLARTLAEEGTMEAWLFHALRSPRMIIDATPLTEKNKKVFYSTGNSGKLKGLD